MCGKLIVIDCIVLQLEHNAVAISNCFVLKITHEVSRVNVSDSQRSESCSITEIELDNKFLEAHLTQHHIVAINKFEDLNNLSEVDSEFLFIGLHRFERA